MGAYRLDPTLPVDAEVRRVARAQLDRAIQELDLTDRHEAAHEVRKRCKKLRGLIRLVRGTAGTVHQEENPALRDTARRLAGDRDLAASVEALDELDAAASVDLDESDVEVVRAGLIEERDRDVEPWDQQRTVVLAELQAVQERVTGWVLPGVGFEVLAGGLHRTYRRACKRMVDAAEVGTPEALHEWRKRVKYHWYHLQLLRNAWPPVLRAQARQVHELSELLGHERDLTLLLGRLHTSPDSYGGAAVVARIGVAVEQRRGELRAAAFPLGQRCFAERPRDLVNRIEGYWQTAT